jgi:hypothetical protein
MGVRPLLCLIGLTASAGVLAQASDSEISRVVTNQSTAAQPARAEPRAATRSVPGRALSAGAADSPVDSVAGDLQRIVVLCATEPSSEDFKQAWASYVEKHDVSAASLDAVIDDVLEQAAAYRARRSSSARATRVTTAPATTRAMMHDTAMAVIRKIG